MVKDDSKLMQLDIFYNENNSYRQVLLCQYRTLYISIRTGIQYGDVIKKIY